MEEFGKEISPDKREEFEAKLKNIENLPREKQEELAKKQLHGIITSEEQEKLQKQLAKCSSHRKEYFVKYQDSIFKTENIIGASHVQGGGIKQFYATSFDTRIHVGFTHGENRTIATHFLKDL
ncbi:unnamed protein product [Adineta steineri]|uniref:Uncharacterized protein n=1 Tax=Adineta steineri TaxID=433720 RepID=A0A819B892_9BILA|nr:unnamed protein product [Adineta steineri]CAF1402087.1 unnamed protein product [Adineta steineri]CAF3702660.1 unnamed protein product [Adineta steineri]CAF3794189.1 unnamed protein product [Adineta steineri]